LHILSLFYAIATPGEQHHQSAYSISVGHVSSTDNRCYIDFSNKYTFLIPCIIRLVKGARECNQYFDWANPRIEFFTSFFSLKQLRSSFLPLWFCGNLKNSRIWNNYFTASIHSQNRERKEPTYTLSVISLLLCSIWIFM
jgi:hypothetical protein